MRFSYHNYAFAFVFFLAFIIGNTRDTFAQAQINFGSSFMVFSGTGIYLVIDNSNANAVLRPGTGHAISSNEFQRIRWRIANGTGNYLFPFGKNTTEYCPFTANITTAGTGAGYFDVSTWYAPAPAHNPLPSGGFSICPSTAKIIERFWRVEPAGYTTTPTAAHIRFYYLTSELNGIPEAMLKAQRGDLSIIPCPWDNPVGTVNTTQKFVQVDNVSQFSPWTLSHQNYPLPVELVHLTAEWVAESKEHQARLQWQTIHEHGSDFFEIERSWDGIRFEGIGRVAAAGRSIEPRWYEYIDQVPSFAAVVYYRLRQVDLDGSHQYSRIVALHRQKNPDVLLVYPNPTTDWIEFKIRNVQNTSLPVEVIDNTGRVVYKGVALLGKEGNAYTLKTDNLPAGLYLLRITIEGDSFAAKFVIEK